MNTSITLRFGTILLVVCLLLLPAGVGAQCMTAMVVAMTNTTALPMDYIYVQKYLSGTYNCVLVMSMNVIDCRPGTMAMNEMILSATAYTVATDPSCSWSCACGTVTATTADGLPVELLDFEIDGGSGVESGKDEGAP